MSEDIKPWLYAVADRKIKAYIRKRPQTLSLDVIPEHEQMIDFNLDGSILDTLNKEESKLMRDYFNGKDKIKLAESYGIRLSNLYMKISRIKNKLRKNLDENDE